MSSTATRAGAGISSRAICCGGMTGSAVAVTLACTGAEALEAGADATGADVGVTLAEDVRASPRISPAWAGRNASIRSRLISKPARPLGARCRSRRPLIAI